MFFIACEGQNTEPKYFEAFSKKHGSKRIKIKPIPRDEPGNSSPKSVFDTLDNFKKNQKTYKTDKFWVVIDRDKWTEKEQNQRKNDL